MNQVLPTLATIFLVALAGTPATGNQQVAEKACVSIEEGGFDCDRQRLSALPGNATFATGMPHLLNVDEGGAGNDAEAPVRLRVSSPKTPAPLSVEEGGFDIERSEALAREQGCVDGHTVNC